MRAGGEDSLRTSVSRGRAILASLLVIFAAMTAPVGSSLIATRRERTSGADDEPDQADGDSDRELEFASGSASRTH